MKAALLLNLGLGLALALGLAGCKGEDKTPGGRPRPISAAERKRGDDACQSYVKRLCLCAETKPELKDRCEIKHAKPEALVLALEVDDNPEAAPREVAQAQDQARKIIAKCIEENAALDAECP